MKKEVPIDKLLQWAYGDELLKNPNLLEPGTLASIYGPMLKFGQYYCRIDQASGGDWPWMPEIAGPPHVDALKLDAAVAGLKSYEIPWPESKEYIMGALAPMTPDDDSRLKYNAPGVKGMIITCATLKHTPQWGPEIPKPNGITAGRNNVMVVPPKGSGERIYKDGAHCPLIYEPKHAEVARERIEYAAWHGAIRKIADDLADNLTAHRPISPMAAERPWAGEQNRETRILYCIPRPSRTDEVLPATAAVAAN